MIDDGVNKYLYDAEGRICAVSNSPVPGTTTMTGYIYDGDGNRIGKGSITTWGSCDPTINGFQAINSYVIGPGGVQATEMGMDSNGSVVWQHTNIYAGGTLIGTYDPDGLHFYSNDPLGTRRAQTDYAGVVEQDCTSLPFGDSLACTNSLQNPTEQHFTGKERDTESGNDYFGARYYASSMGRFTSPDPLLSSGRPGNPQTWNRYAYAGNNPLRNIDPSGLYFFTNTCASDDQTCNAAFAQTQASVRAAYAATQSAYNNAVAAGDTEAAGALKRTLDGLGAEGQKNANGQTVNISADPGLNAPGQTSFAKGSTSIINIVLNPGMSNGDQGAEAAIAHEGVHADEITPGMPTFAQAYSLEHDAYQTESYFSQAIGYQNIHSPSDGSDMVNGVLNMNKDFVLWNPSWASADRATINSHRSAGVDGAAKDGANVDCQQGGCKK